jgi:ribosomal protein RSM22 (predicted rRNA methylase)
MSSHLAALLAPPLEDDWRAAIDAVARARQWPTSDAPAQLGALVRALSDAYNAPAAGHTRAVASSAPALAARLGFSFARDVPKSAAAVRELVCSPAFAARDRFRVLDVGAGLGATTWGVARALAKLRARRPGAPGVAIDALWVDEDAMALDVARDLWTARHGREDAVSLAVHTERRRATDALRGHEGRFDLVLLGQVLSELDAQLDEEQAEERVKRHADLVAAFVGALAPGGAVVVVEPALRERTRHLHAVRDALLARGACTVFAPCLHASPCPAFAVEGEWCHEDLPIDLPEWLVPVARAAGLRWQGLTFSYLVVRAPGEPTLASVLPPAAARMRVISEALVSKGKREHFVCAEDGARRRVTRLDRDGTEANAAFEALARGDVAGIDPSPDRGKPRVPKDAHVTLLGPEIGLDLVDGDRGAK